MHKLLEIIFREIQDLETVGVLFGLISVGLTVRENIWCWSFGIVNVLLFARIFFLSAIYGQMLLQFFFLILSLYGWYEWLYGGEEKRTLRITKINRKQIFILIPVTIFFVFLIETGIRFVSEKENFTKLDSIITAMSFTAQYLLAKKIIESWIIWILVNILSIYLFIQTGLLKIGFFYCILLILATIGYYTWKRKADQQVLY